MPQSAGRSFLLVVLALAVVSAPSLRALHVRADLENVPISRLVTNLEALVSASPGDVRLKLNLARVHAMAFSSEKIEVQARKGNARDGVWFGYDPDAVPFGRVEPNRAREASAREHLEKAIALYAQAIALNQRAAPASPPESFPLAEKFDLTLRLGYAWCIEQSGDRTKAIAEYRDVLQRAWRVEGEQRRLSLGPPITPEAFFYLRPLLDAVKDSDELKLWDERATQVSRMIRPVTPVAIPLRDGMTIDDVVAPGVRVSFDADGTGLRKRWTWIGPDAGWLVYDQRGTREITSALQLFGGVTLWLFWHNGYEPMRALDDNGDGRLEGPELDHTAIWRDANQDGVSDAGEVLPLSDWRIVSLSCAYELTDDARTVAMSTRGVTFRSGRTRPTWDVVLRQ